MQEKEEQEIIQVQEEPKKKKKKWFIIIILALLLLLGMHRCSNKELENANMSAYVLGDGFSPGLSEEEIQELLQKEIDKNKIAFSVYTKPIFKGKKGTIMFGNPRHNLYDIDLEVKIGDRTIIKTDKVAPNKYIAEIELMGKALKKGEHKANGRIKAYDRKTGELSGEVAVDMKIVVK